MREIEREAFFMKKLFIFVLAFIFAALPLASCKKQEPMLTADMDIVYIYVTALSANKTM